MDAILNRYRNLVVLGVVVIAQLLLLGVQVKGNQDVWLIRTWAVSAIMPIAQGLEWVRGNTVGVVRNTVSLWDARNENGKLKAELDRLKMENHFLRTELNMADRVRALSVFQSRTPSRSVAARIVGMATSANEKVVYIDRGSSAGVQRGMAVVTPDGIVGKVLAAFPMASQVMLITDPNFAAGVVSQKNRVHGTLKGQGHSTCKVDYVQNEELVEPGEMFYTSGDDRIFPKGMPVGAVKVIRRGTSFKEVFVTPAGLQRGLEEVLVIVAGVHGQIPETTGSDGGIYQLPSPPAEMTEALPNASTDPARMNTDADRLRERYRRIAESQNIELGSGTVITRPPNFNVAVDMTTPSKPKPAPVAAATGAATPAGTPMTAGTVPTTSGAPIPAAKPPGAGTVAPPSDPSKPAEPPKAAEPKSPVILNAAQPGDSAPPPATDPVKNPHP